ncbi:hypothetical protein HYS31_01305 [Candidatus Woesearchaeota archaeon]|nr:hypothetical protein [Candidatus Woesearchaeota archaeon]
MNWKEFFRLTKVKVILTLILFLLVVLITFSSKECAACISPGQCGVAYCIPGPHFIYVASMLFLLIFGLPIAIFSILIGDFVNRPFNPMNIPGSLLALLVFLIELLWIYLVACMAYSIYRKLRNKIL